MFLARDSVLESSWSVLPFLPVAISAEKRPVSIRLKRQFSDLGPTFGASPIALVHLAVAAVVVI